METPLKQSGGQDAVSVSRSPLFRAFPRSSPLGKGNAPSWPGIVRVKMKRMCAVNRGRRSQQPSWDSSGHVLLSQRRTDSVDIKFPRNRSAYHSPITAVQNMRPVVLISFSSLHKCSKSLSQSPNCPKRLETGRDTPKEVN